MGKKFSTKKLRLRSRAARRRQALRVESPVVHRKPTLEEQNREVIARIEAKIAGNSPAPAPVVAAPSKEEE